MKQFPLFAAFCLLLSIPGAAHAQASGAATPDLVVHLTRAQATRFQDALDALAAQAHVAIVAEGAPLHPALTGKDVPDLPANTPLSTAVTKIAAAYDYSAERQGGVFVLKKRYTDPEDLPDVTLDECRQSLDDVLRVLDAFNPHLFISIREPLSDRLAMDFVKTLTPEQERAMQAKNLHYTDLTPGQQALIVRTILYETVQMQADGFQGLQDIFAQAPKSVIRTQAQGRKGVFLEYTQTERRDPLYPNFQRLAWASLTFEAPLADGEAPPPARPVAQSPPARGATLGEVVDGLNAALGRKAQEAPMAVEAALRAKPVTAAGLGNAAPLDALRALAAVYGLRIGASDRGGPLLERASSSAPRALPDLPQALRAALPAPLLRAMHDGQPVPPHSLPMPKLAPDAPPAQWEAAFQKYAQDDKENEARKKQYRMRPAYIKAEAGHRLVAALRPALLRAGADPRLPVSSLDEGTRDLLGLYLMVGVMDILNDGFLKPGQEWMTADYNQMVIRGKPYVDPNWPGGRPDHSLFMKIPHPLPDGGNTDYSLGGIGYGD